jgi:hypothetical protein
MRIAEFLDTPEWQEEEYMEAVANRSDRWVVACGGREAPFTYCGTRWVYVFNPSTEKHGYLNLDTDVVHDDYRTERN